MVAAGLAPRCWYLLVLVGLGADDAGDAVAVAVDALLLARGVGAGRAASEAAACSP